MCYCYAGSAGFKGFAVLHHFQSNTVVWKKDEAKRFFKENFCVMQKLMQKDKKIFHIKVYKVFDKQRESETNL